MFNEFYVNRTNSLKTQFEALNLSKSPESFRSGPNLSLTLKSVDKKSRAALKPTEPNRSSRSVGTRQSETCNVISRDLPPRPLPLSLPGAPGWSSGGSDGSPAGQKQPEPTEQVAPTELQSVLKRSWSEPQLDPNRTLFGPEAFQRTSFYSEEFWWVCLWFWTRTTWSCGMLPEPDRTQWGGPVLLDFKLFPGVLESIWTTMDPGLCAAGPVRFWTQWAGPNRDVLTVNPQDFYMWVSLFICCYCCLLRDGAAGLWPLG